MSAWPAWLAAEAKARERTALERAIATTEGATEPWAVRDGTRMLNLSSNSYLGLSSHPALRAAAEQGAARGAGAGSSRLVVGSDTAYKELEGRVAELKGAERALVLGSGYLANVGALACLLDRDCAVVSDTLNHASIIDGVRLSRARVYRYRHADIDELEAQLAEATKDGHRRVMVVTNTVFSMDGDVAPLAKIVELKKPLRRGANGRRCTRNRGLRGPRRWVRERAWPERAGRDRDGNVLEGFRRVRRLYRCRCRVDRSARQYEQDPDLLDGSPRPR